MHFVCVHKRDLENYGGTFRVCVYERDLKNYGGYLEKITETIGENTPKEITCLDVLYCIIKNN